MRIQKTDNYTSFKSLPEQRKATEIAKYLLQRRRQFEPGSLSLSSRNYLLNSIISAILPFVKKEEPIPMVILGFPGKSPSRLRTLSADADRAEFEALKCLANFTDGVSQIYKPGANMDIYSDGRVFVGSIVGLSDDNVSKYISQIKVFLKRLGIANIKINSLEDYYSGSFDEARKLLGRDFPADPINPQDACVQKYIEGMRIFFGSDIKAQNPACSRKESKRLGEEIAKAVITTGDSFAKFISSIYSKGMLRLSIHPKPFDSSKHGIFLNSLHENCPTPWQGAAIKLPSNVDNNERFLYEKRATLEKAGAVLVSNNDNKGCFFEFSSDTYYDTSKSLHENLARIIDLSK